MNDKAASVEALPPQDLPRAKRSRRRLLPLAYDRLRSRQDLSADRLMSRAVGAAGSGDWGDRFFRAGLAALLDDVHANPLITPFGASMLNGQLESDLTEILAIRRWAASDPSISEIALREPVLIAGLPRTGTTLLHRALALDPGFRAPLRWEMERPTPPPQPEEHARDPRIKQTARGLRLLHYLAPALDHIHPIDATAPEDCYVLLNRTFCSPALAFTGIAPTYFDWLWGAGSDAVPPAYELYRLQLQVLGWRFPAESRWLLKSYAHMPFLDSFVAAMPGTRVISTHRDPMTTLASFASLVATFHSIWQRSVDYEQLGRFVLELAETMVSRYMRAREALDPGHFHDVRYEDLVADPAGTVAGVHRFLGLSFDRERAGAVERFATRTGKGVLGSHRYTPEQFGLDRDAIDERLGGYRQRFGV